MIIELQAANNLLRKEITFSSMKRGIRLMRAQYFEFTVVKLK